MRHTAVLFFAFIAGPLAAQSVPGTINYQGRLTDNTPAQTPVTASVQMQFAIFDAAGGGTRLWQEPAADNTGTPVTVTAGIFNYILGNAAPITPAVFTGATSARYLQITLNPAGSAEILTPRQLITATGYANLAQNANSAVTAASATTAASLATNGANCPAGSYPLGVSAAGAAEGCTVAGAGTVTSVSAAAPLSVTNPTTTPAITLGTVPVASGGTGATAPGAAGGVLFSNGSVFSPTAAGSATQLLHGGATPAWAAVSLNDLGASGCANGDVPRFNGSTWSCAAAGGPLTTFVTGSLPTATLTTLLASNGLPVIALGADGFPVVAYSSGATILVQKCQDAACTVLTAAQTISTGSSVSLMVGPSGFPSLVFTNAGIRYVRCLNATCSALGPLAMIDTGTQGTLTFGTDGLPVIAYVSNPNLRVAKCANIDCAGPAQTTVNSNTNGYNSPAIALGADGLPVIAVEAQFGFVRVVKCGNAACSAGITVTDIGSGYEPSLTVGNDGRTLIAWRDLSTGIFLTRCLSAACTVFSTALAAPCGSALLFHPSVGIGFDGQPVIAFETGPNGSGPHAPSVLRCGSPECATGGTLVNLDASPAAGNFGNVSYVLAIPRDGIPIVVYGDNGFAATKLAKCFNPSCLPWTRR